MAFDLWKGPGGRSTEPTSGDWFTATNWSRGAAPDASLDAVLGAGDYAVTLTGAAAHVRSVSIGGGATLAITGGASLTTDAASLNQGTLSIAGAALVLGGDFQNLGALYGEVTDGYIAGVFGGGTLFNDGLITVRPGAGTPYLSINGSLVNDADGVISSGSGVVFLLGATTNGGRIEALNGGLVSTNDGPYTLGGPGTVTNLMNGVLTGGTWAMGANSTIWLSGSTINALGDGTVVTLDGVGSNLRIDDGSGDPFYVEGTLNQVRAGATLEVLGGRDWVTSENLSVAGALHLGGGIFAPGDLRIDRDATISGFGSVASQAVVDGLMKVNGGETLQFTNFADFNGKIAGNGTLEQSGGADTFTTSKVTVKHLLFDGANVEFDKNLNYAGELTATTGTIEVKDSKLTLSGEASIGAVTINSGPGGSLSVAGELRAHGGDAEITVRTVRVDGTLSVDHGSLLVDGAVGGSGTIEIGASGVLEAGPRGRLSSGPLVAMTGDNGTLVFDTLDTGGAHIAQFDGKDAIDFAGLSSTGARLSWRADADGEGGTLKVTNGGQTATVHLEENHTRADFVLKTDADGGAVVTLAKSAAFGLADAGAFGADAHVAPHVFAVAHDLHWLLALE